MIENVLQNYLAEISFFYSKTSSAAAIKLLIIFSSFAHPFRNHLIPPLNLFSLLVISWSCLHATLFLSLSFFLSFSLSLSFILSFSLSLYLSFFLYLYLSISLCGWVRERAFTWSSSRVVLKKYDFLKKI